MADLAANIKVGLESRLAFMQSGPEDGRPATFGFDGLEGRETILTHRFLHRHGPTYPPYLGIKYQPPATPRLGPDAGSGVTDI